MKRLLLAIAVLLGLQTLAVADPLPVPSLWKNQRGSTLQAIWSFPPGLANYTIFNGIFINRAPGFQCQGTPYGAAGTTSPTQTSFEVVFLLCNSRTTWVGQVRGTKMYTRWTLVYAPPGQQPQTYRGHDIFTRIQ